MGIDYDGSLKLLAICVALAAYVSNVRRDMAKRCTSLKEDIKEKLPIQLKEEKIDAPSMEDLVRVKEKKISDIENKIRGLMWGDVPLVLASITVLFHWLSIYVFKGCPALLYVAITLFGIAVLGLACQHFKEWFRK